MNIECIYCGSQNIEGSDDCEKCGQSISEDHLQQPTTDIERGLLKDRISDLSPKPAVTVSDSATVGEVLQTLVENSIGCVFIVDPDGKLVGVFSERDALMRLNSDAKKLVDRPIRDYMTPNPQRLTSDTKIAYALYQMDVGHFRHIPIMDDKVSSIGVISVRDILRYVTSMAS